MGEDGVGTTARCRFKMHTPVRSRPDFPPLAAADNRDPSSFQPQPTAALHILLALTEGEKHGYALLGDVERLSDGAVKVGAGTLYGSIKRMLADGLIQETEERPDPALDDQRRRYYRLTGLGERVAAAELQRLATLLQRTSGRMAGRPRLGEA